jgi:hypothetical protein
MNSKIHILSIAPVAAWLLTACNYTDGPCWRRGEGSEGAGAGTGDGSVILSSGSGDFGDTPPQGNGDPPLKCNEDDEDNEDDKDSHSDSPKSPPQSQCLGVGDTAGDGSTFSSCTGPCTSTCPPADVVNCALRVDHPHESMHEPGTVNVIAYVECDRPVAGIKLVVQLKRDGQEVAWKDFEKSGVAELRGNAATSRPCVVGAYHGEAAVIITYYPPAFPATGTLGRKSATKEITCKR